MAEHDCGHLCCDERGDPFHDHFLLSAVCPDCQTRRVLSRRTVARLCRENDGKTHWTEEAVRSLIGQEPVPFFADDEPQGAVRIVDARLEDGWVVVELEPVDG